MPSRGGRGRSNPGVVASMTAEMLELDWVSRHDFWERVYRLVENNIAPSFDDKMR